MNITKLYSVTSGLSGKGFLKKSVLAIIAIFYMVTLLYILLFEIEWLNQVTPIEILYGGYRNTAISSYASVVSFLFIIMFLNILYYVNTHTNEFFRTSTVKLLQTGGVSSLLIFSSYFLWRCFKIFKINILYLIPLLLLYAIRDGVFVYSMVYNIYILFYSSILIVVIYDILFFTTKKSNSSFVLTIIIILFFSILSSMLGPMVEDILPGVAVKQIYYLILDIISLPYQYVLKSLGATYSIGILYYSMVPAAFLLITNIYLSKSLLKRLAVTGT